MATTTRIYEVPVKNAAAGSPSSYLVDAKSREAAERHVASKFIGDAEIAAPKRIAEVMASGVKIETPAE